jgi:MFS family permease
MLGAIGLYNWTRSLPVQYDQLYITALGANPLELGSLSSIAGAVNAVVSAPMGWLADKYGVKKVIVFGLVLATIASAIYGLATDWWMIIPGIILAQVGMGLIMPLTDIIFIGTTNPVQRATSIGFARALWAIPCTVVPLVSAFLVTTFGGISVQGIRPIYFFVLASYLFVLFTVVVMLRPLLYRESNLDNSSDNNGDKQKSKSFEFIQDLKELFKGEKSLKKWIILWSIQRFGTSLAMPFVPLWLVQQKGADPTILGVMGVVSIAMSVLLQIPAGRLADKIGRKKAYLLFHPIIYLGSLLLILATSSEYLILVGLLGAIGLQTGVVGAAGISGIAHTPFITLFWEMVPAEKRGRWHGVTGVLGLIGIPATLLGGFLWEHELMMPVLIIPMILEGLVVLPLFLSIPETLNKSK